MGFASFFRNLTTSEFSSWLGFSLISVSVWEIGSRLYNTPFLLPAPSRILEEFLKNPSLVLTNAFITTQEIVVGFVLGSLIALVSAIVLMALPKFIEDFIFRLVTTLFGTDYPQNLLEARVNQKLPLVMLAVDFQDSAMRILSWKPIAKASEISGQFATWIGYDKPIKAAVGKGWEKSLQVVNQQGDPATIGGWLGKQYQFASGMIYNEVMVAAAQTKEKYYVYDYKKFGVDWQENVLFTTEDVLKKYPNEVKKFVQARYKGFKFAFDEPEEAGKILAKYNPNLDIAFELKGLAQIKTIMVTPDTQKNGLGYVRMSKLSKMAAQLVKAGLLEDAPMTGFVKATPSNVKP